MSIAAVLAVIWGLKRTAEDGWAWLPAASVLAGLALGWLFAARQRRLAEPLVDLQLFHHAGFTGALVSYMLGCVALFGIYIFIAQYLQTVLGLSPLMAGLATVPWALGFVGGALVVPALTRRFERVAVVTGGQVVAVAGFLVMTQVSGEHALAVLIAGSTLAAVGMAPVFTLANDLMIGAAPPERAGSAAAISETSSELGGALGIALLGSLVTAVYGSLTSPEAVARGLVLTSAISAALIACTLVVAARLLGVRYDLLRPRKGKPCNTC